MLAWVLNLGFAASSSAVSPPTFTGTIANITLNEGSPYQTYDYSGDFTGATSYSISPIVPTGWSFDTATCILSVHTDTVGSFGPFTITGTNGGGSANSNAFTATIVLNWGLKGGLPPKKKKDWRDRSREARRLAIMAQLTPAEPLPPAPLAVKPFVESQALRETLKRKTRADIMPAYVEVPIPQQVVDDEEEELLLLL